MFGGKVGVVGFSGVSVEAVCRDDVHAVLLMDFDRQGEAALPLGQGTAAGDGIFHQVPEQADEVELRDGQRFRDPELPVCIHAVGVSYPLIIIEQGIQGGVGTVIHRRFDAPALLIFLQMGFQIRQISRFGQCGQDMDGLTEIVAQPSGLLHIILESSVLIRLHFQNPGAFHELRMFQKRIRQMVKNDLNEEKKDEHHNLQGKEHRKNPAGIQGLVGMGNHQYVEQKEYALYNQERIPYLWKGKLAYHPGIVF